VNRYAFLIFSHQAENSLKGAHRAAGSRATGDRAARSGDGRPGGAFRRQAAGREGPTRRDRGVGPNFQQTFSRLSSETKVGVA